MDALAALPRWWKGHYCSSNPSSSSFQNLDHLYVP